MVEEIITAGFRALARRYHPDVGGDTATMQRLNAAYDRIRALVKIL
jgi:curved DNA-binding protein CbpA